jgi:aspartyl-tRNA(Asn)/glutamyl-tRNA(Gln) amidotransferase subunit B
VVKTVGSSPKLCANWVMGDFSASLNKQVLELVDSPVSAEALGGLLLRIEDKTISGKIAKQVFEIMWQEKTAADVIIEQQGLKQITDAGAIEGIIDEILINNPTQLTQYREGKDKLFGFFVGQVMKATKGKANPGQVNQLLKQKLQG